MMNPLAVQLSEMNITHQMNILIKRCPFITSVLPSDPNTDMRADYLENVDAVAKGYDGKLYNVQFKIRQADNNDFILIAKKLTGKSVMASNMGFTYKGNKYTFDLRSADIYVETLGDGETYILSREEINSLERLPYLGLTDAITGIQPKKVYADNGSPFPTGDFYVFISGKKINSLKRSILEQNLH